MVAKELVSAPAEERTSLLKKAEEAAVKLEGIAARYKCLEITSVDLICSWFDQIYLKFVWAGTFGF